MTGRLVDWLKSDGWAWVLLVALILGVEAWIWLGWIA